MKIPIALLGAALLNATVTASAALTIDYANKGADGAFNPTGATYVVNLALATNADWQAAPAVPGNGVYDADKWAVVFKFTSINIPANTTVRFLNHPSRAPVVWLVESNVTIAGTVNLNGTGGSSHSPNSIVFTEPGPGGFRGGDATTGGYTSGGGLGPGGGLNYFGSGPSYSSASFGTTPFEGFPSTYGNERIIPLIGGSGGGGFFADVNRSGGAGGGAILIAASGTITVAGSITAYGGAGGWGHGSGGACRLIAEQIAGSGAIDVRGPSSAGWGDGRISLETTNPVDTTLQRFPPVVAISPLPVKLWPDVNQPTARIISVSAIQPPSDPRSDMQYALPADVRLAANSRTNRVVVETTYLPSSAQVVLRTVARNGGDFAVTCHLAEIDANPNILRWTNSVVLAPGYHAMQVRATAP